MTVYSNIQQALDELLAIANAYPKRFYRLGTGEITDSLSLDDLTLYSRKLIHFFKSLPNWTLEFKSKSSKVDQFLDVEHSGNVITSWSINPKYIVDGEEHETASLNSRLKAAEKCRDKGFKVTFHLDPIIWHPQWKKNYSELIDQIIQRFKPTEIPYVTAGALRFVPEQKSMMRDRFGMKSHVVSGETFLSATGKMRYDSHLRAQMFEFIQKKFKSHDSRWRISLCMEAPETWVTTMATGPRKIDELSELFNPPQRGSSHNLLDNTQLNA